MKKRRLEKYKYVLICCNNAFIFVARIMIYMTNAEIKLKYKNVFWGWLQMKTR